MIWYKRNLTNRTLRIIIEVQILENELQLFEMINEKLFICFYDFACIKSSFGFCQNFSLFKQVELFSIASKQLLYGHTYYTDFVCLWVSANIAARFIRNFNIKDICKKHLDLFWNKKIVSQKLHKYSRVTTQNKKSKTMW